MKMTGSDETSPLSGAPAPLTYFMRLANSVPNNLRRFRNKQIHDLAVRYLAIEDEPYAASCLKYLQRCVNEFPPILQAFVFCEEYGSKGADDVDWNVFPNRVQIGRNFGLFDLSESEVQEILAVAGERVEAELGFAFARSETSVIRHFSHPVIGPHDYSVRGFTFQEVGLIDLAVRARQRFFFILAADELLFALTSQNPDRELEHQFYFELTGCVDSYLTVDDGVVGISTPFLFSFVQNVLTSRLRRCQVCSNYFWAARKDKNVCSTKCGSTRRKRNQRQARQKMNA